MHRVSAQLVVLHKPQLLRIEQDFSSIHSFLSRLLRAPPLSPSPPPVRSQDVHEGVEGGAAVHNHHTGSTATTTTNSSSSSSSQASDKSHKSAQPAGGKEKEKTPPSEARRRALHTPSYPFDLRAAVALTDRLLAELPPAELFLLAEADLRSMIRETK
jgi:hypothetical protein